MKQSTHVCGLETEEAPQVNKCTGRIYTRLELTCISLAQSGILHQQRRLANNLITYFCNNFIKKNYNVKTNEPRKYKYILYKTI